MLPREQQADRTTEIVCLARRPLDHPDTWRELDPPARSKEIPGLFPINQLRHHLERGHSGPFCKLEEAPNLKYLTQVRQRRFGMAVHSRRRPIRHPCRRQLVWRNVDLLQADLVDIPKCLQKGEQSKHLRQI